MTIVVETRSLGGLGPTPLPDQIQPKVSVTDRLKLGISFIPKMDGLWLKNKKIARAFFEKTRVLYVAMAEKPLLSGQKWFLRRILIGFGRYFGGVCFLEFFDSVIGSAVSEISLFSVFTQNHRIAI